MPLNQMLYDEQVELIRTAEVRAKAGVSGPQPMPFKPTQPSLRAAVGTMPTVRQQELFGAMASTRATVELTRAQVAAVDGWAREWDVTRCEVIDRLIDQGGGGSSHLMRSS